MKNNIRFSNPWVTGLQGIIMILFGISALVNPEVTLKTITRFFGIIMVISGVFLVALTKSKSKDLPEFWFYEGLANILIGLIFIFLPHLITNIFVILLGLVALIVGLRNLWYLINSKPNFLMLSIVRNIILVAFGLLFLFVPFQGAKLIINIIGFAALIYGILTAVVAYKAYKLGNVENI